MSIGFSILPKQKVALSACLLGCLCRYDGKENLNKILLSQLEDYEIISFCPEESAFGTPRPTMDLIENNASIRAISNETSLDLSTPIFDYAQDFFKEHSDIKLFIGKDRSPSCGVKSAKVYDNNKKILHTHGTGFMAKIALELGIECWDSEVYQANHIF